MTAHRPHFGHTQPTQDHPHGLPVHLHTLDHWRHGHPGDSAYKRFNDRLALWITQTFLSMTMFYVFNLLALCSLPAVLVLVGPGLARLFPAVLIRASTIALVAWVAQTYFQLVLLPGIGVGQDLQNTVADARNKLMLDTLREARDGVLRALGLLDTRTEGGLKTVLDAVAKLGDQTAELADAIRAVLAARTVPAVPPPGRETPARRDPKAGP